MNIYLITFNCIQNIVNNIFFYGAPPADRFCLRKTHSKKSKGIKKFIKLYILPQLRSSERCDYVGPTSAYPLKAFKITKFTIDAEEPYYFWVF